jgi:diguanylate cyclase (GGDEF)-like protein/PAS domain S-box-containing protein
MAAISQCLNLSNYLFMHKAESDESDRLDALKSYEILDTLPEAGFDRLARLVAHVCEAPMATLSLVDAERQWFKAVVGPNMIETDRVFAFCAHAIRGKELFVVQDARKDPLFEHNALVSQNPHICFYAGMPLVSPDGFAMGALAIMDWVPRTLTATQTEALETLAAQATMQLELCQRVAVETESKRREKKHAEKIRLQLQQDFHQFAEAMPQIVWTARADGTVDYASGAFRDYIENLIPELLGQRWMNTIHPDDVDRCIAAWSKSIQTGSVYSIDLRLGRRDPGSYRWHLVRAVPIRDESGRIDKWYGTATDTHDHKVAEEQVSRLARRLVTTLESITDAFFTLDRAWRFTYLNQEAEHLLQRPRADLLGRTIWDEFKEAVGSIFDKQYHRALEENCTVVFEEFYSPLSKWLEARAYPSDEGLAVYFRDTSGRKYAEEALHRANEMFQLVLDHVPQRIFWKSTDQRYLGSNRLFAQDADFRSAEEVGGKTDYDIYSEDSAAARRHGDALILQAGIPKLNYEEHRLRSDGRVQWLRTSKIPLHDLGGGIIGLLGTYEDITEQKKAEDNLRLWERALAATTNGILIVDASQAAYSVVYANGAFERMSGYSAREILGRNPQFLLGTDVDQSAYQEIDAALRERRDCRAILRAYRSDGQLFWIELSLSPVCNSANEVMHFVAVLTDITERKRYEAELEYRATHDALTRLPNHGLLQDRLLRAITLANHNQRSAAVLIVDFGRFQIINDTVGREAADQLLCQMAGRLQALFHGTETVARQGSDEFAVVVEQVEGEQQCAELARLIMQAMTTPFTAAGKEFYASSSIGMALYPKDGTTTAELLRNADAAMAQAKQLGRNNFQFYTATMSERARVRLTLENALRNALERGEFVLHYQPQVNLQTGAMVGMEALLRWQHPELGLIRPDRFIPLAEETGLIVPIGTWVLRTACAQAAAWQREGMGNLRVAVNLSASQFAQRNFACVIAKTLEETGLAAALLDLELTENLVMTDVERTISILNDLRALGVRFSIDDFGTGYSSLSYLKRLPIDVLKIDRSFVNDISHNANDAAISRAIISLAHTLGIQVIAEGVETQAQCEFLSQNMCDEIQGYLFSEPLPASELEALLQEDRQLPQHLLRLHKPLRTLLLVDDEPNILSALKRLLRRDSYKILTAASGKEGLELLAKNEIDVIVSDQRMPGMTGVDFLRTVKTLYPETVRIVLSGFTELQSVTDAVNEGAIYKFLTKPWDDNQLREHITHAFHHKEMIDENRRLTLEVRTANHDLATANRRLEEVLEQKQLQITRSKVSLDIVREALQHVPLPVFGLDDDEMVAFVNHAAEELYADTGPILGGEAAHLMPQLMHAIYNTVEGKECKVKLNGITFHAVTRNMGNGTQSRGKLIILSRCDAA